MGTIKDKCLLVCARPVDITIDQIDPTNKVNMDEYFVIGADRGYVNCTQLGIIPDIILGDFDSSSPPQTTTMTEVYPAQKDDTDSMLGIKKAIALGYKQLVMIGALGGRLDHTYANIQSLVYMMNHGCHGRIIDSKHTVQLVYPDHKLTIEKFDGYLSVFAYTPTVEGVTISGVFYRLDNAQLTSAFPLGVSNQITADRATISCTQGVLVVMTAIENHEE